MDSDAVSRIIDAVGADDYRKPKSREDLGARLDWAGFWHGVNVDLRRSSTSRDKRLSAALKAANRYELALQALDKDDMPTKPPKGELQIGVELLKAALSPPAPESEWQQKAAKKMIRELHLKERSSLEWLVGVELPRIFKKFFVLKKGPSVGFSRGKAKEALGPYIRFAEQALRELGITNHGEPYSADTIAKALFDARKRRSRRTLGKAK